MAEQREVCTSSIEEALRLDRSYYMAGSGTWARLRPAFRRERVDLRDGKVLIRPPGPVLVQGRSALLRAGRRPAKCRWARTPARGRVEVAPHQSRASLFSDSSCIVFSSVYSRLSNHTVALTVASATKAPIPPAASPAHCVQ